MQALLVVAGQTRLLEKNPTLDASIRLRLPYIAIATALRNSD
jgi:phosphoenolpyruvate carboxylase